MDIKEIDNKLNSVNLEVEALGGKFQDFLDAMQASEGIDNLYFEAHTKINKLDILKRITIAEMSLRYLREQFSDFVARVDEQKVQHLKNYDVGGSIGNPKNYIEVI